MPALQIPLVNGKNYYYFNTTLDGVIYKFTIRWNNTDLAWYLSIASVIDTSVDLKGIRLICGIDLLYQYHILKLGGLYMIDNDNKLEDPNFADFGTRFTMMYLPKGETL
jgi:hypothetical protein